jgi:hypothetical protein
MKTTINKLIYESGNWKKVMTFGSVEVTPEMAASFLSMNTNNRPIRDSEVSKNAKLMREGKWKFNGACIAISRSGKILDTQHRLMAVVASKTTQVFNIQTGLEDEVFSTYDTGKPRTAADTVNVMGFKKHSTIIGSSLKIIIAYEEKTLFSFSGGNQASRLISNSEIDEVVKSRAIDIDLLLECVSAASKMDKKGKFLKGHTYAAFLYIFSKIDKEAAFQFFSQLATGENLSSDHNSSIYLLRERLTNSALSKLQMQVQKKYALIIKAWNCYRTGKEIKQLSWDNQTFPQPI